MVGRVYLAGYAVECALKACIARRMNQYDFPDKSVVLRAYTHDLSDLLELADLKLRFKLDTTPAGNPGLGTNWQRLKDWNERSRYQQKTERQARILYLAVTDMNEGVMPWVRNHW